MKWLLAWSLLQEVTFTSGSFPHWDSQVCWWASLRTCLQLVLSSAVARKVVPELQTRLNANPCHFKSDLQGL